MKNPTPAEYQRAIDVMAAELFRIATKIQESKRDEARPVWYIRSSVMENELAAKAIEKARFA